MELNESNARQALDSILQNLPPEPRPFSGRGIIVAAGGARYFTCAWVCIQRLRQQGCTLPIEVWYRGHGEMTPNMVALLEPLGVRCIDALDLAHRFPPAPPGGWELKAYALVYSSFLEVLFLDADNIPVENPEYLFECTEYKNTGAVFWPDRGPYPISHKAWGILGLDIPSHHEFESGQILINKSKSWRALRLALWLNEHSYFFYQYLHGDKDTFALAWTRLQQPFHLISTPPLELAATLCQHAPSGQRLFQHRGRDKWTLHSSQTVESGFWHGTECLDAIRKLASLWDGNRCFIPENTSSSCPNTPSLHIVVLAPHHSRHDPQGKLQSAPESHCIQTTFSTIHFDPTPPSCSRSLSEAVRSALNQFLGLHLDRLLILEDHLEIHHHFWTLLRSWKPWQQKQFALGTLYHPGVPEEICDVPGQTDWLPMSRIDFVGGLMLSRETATWCLLGWDLSPRPPLERIPRLSGKKLLPARHPALLQDPLGPRSWCPSHEFLDFL